MEIVEDSTKKRLEQLKIIFEDMKKTFDRDLDRFDIYLNNFVTTSRTITFLLQKEFYKKEGFSNWYSDKQKEMKERGFDKFRDMRNLIEKQGNIINSNVIHITTKKKGESGARLLSAKIEKDGSYKDEVYGSFESKPFFGSLGDFDLTKLDKTMFKECEEYFNYLRNLVKEAYNKFKN